jgi:hypothetical protein
MSSKATVHNSMRIYHTATWAFFWQALWPCMPSAVLCLFLEILIFLKQTKQVQQQLQPGLTADALSKAIRSSDLKIETVNGDVQSFKNGTYNNATGAVSHTTTQLPKMVEKLTHLHKASAKDPLFYLNIFFGVSLLFFVISSFWMCMPKTGIFKKGLYFTLAGVVLVRMLWW